MVLNALRRTAPALAERFMPPAMMERMRSASGAAVRSLPSYRHLAGLMSQFTVDRLVGVDPRAFRQRIDGFLELTDPEMEGYQDAARQRDQSVRFQWGHNHDFGSFALRGAMGDRHVGLVATFVDRFGALPLDLSGKRILDIGCWTGGTSMLLCAMGAEVVAIEEVKKYVDALTYLKEAFAIERLTPMHRSLYECVGPTFDDRFDFVLFAGVIYHVTDPALALRIAFDSLVDGGRCLAETASYASTKEVLRYEGPSRTHRGREEDRNRRGWNWLVPSPPALRRMMEDVGFSEVVVREASVTRAFAVGRRARHVDMLRAGVSVRSIR
jgi:SAM-dependent methyltransferase